MRHILQWSFILNRYYSFYVWSWFHDLRHDRCLSSGNVCDGCSCWSHLLHLTWFGNLHQSHKEDFPGQQTWEEARLHPISCVPMPWPDHITAISEPNPVLVLPAHSFPSHKMSQNWLPLSLVSSAIERAVHFFYLPSGFCVVQHNRDSSSVCFITSVIKGWEWKTVCVFQSVRW